MTANTNPKVTIMIPTYNQVEFIEEAIHSALSQTYPHLEIIVGDDASTDGTSERIANINDPRLKKVRNAINLGRIGNYRNLLNNHATGEYVVNLDGDDFYTDSRFISEAINVTKNRPDIVLVAARAAWIIDGIEFISNIPNRRDIPGIEILKNLPDKNYYFKHMATLYLREQAIKLGFYRTDSNSSDWESLYRLSLYGNVKFLDKVVGSWRIHEENSSSTNNSEKLHKNLTIWPSIYKEAIKCGMNPIVARLRCAKCVAHFASSFFIKTSLNGNADLRFFIQLMLKEFKLAVLICALTPTYIGRLTLSFLGYYRNKYLPKNF